MDASGGSGSGSSGSAGCENPLRLFLAELFDASPEREILDRKGEERELFGDVRAV